MLILMIGMLLNFWGVLERFHDARAHHPQIGQVVAGFQRPALGDQGFRRADVISLVGPVLHHAQKEHVRRGRTRHLYIPVPAQQFIAVRELHIRLDPMRSHLAPVHRHGRIPHFFLKLPGLFAHLLLQFLNRLFFLQPHRVHEQGDQGGHIRHHRGEL